jgi:trimethylamine---corrinoid protein Co-methyltransferase
MAELGPSGNYLEHKHTMRHYRQMYYSNLADKRQYDIWAEDGATTMEERAGKQVDEILANHQPPHLPEDVLQAIHKIVEREQEWADSTAL